MGWHLRAKALSDQKVIWEYRVTPRRLGRGSSWLCRICIGTDIKSPSPSFPKLPLPRIQPLEAPHDLPARNRGDGHHPGPERRCSGPMSFCGPTFSTWDRVGSKEGTGQHPDPELTGHPSRDRSLGKDTPEVPALRSPWSRFLHPWSSWKMGLGRAHNVVESGSCGHTITPHHDAALPTSSHHGNTHIQSKTKPHHTMQYHTTSACNAILHQTIPCHTIPCHTHSTIQYNTMQYNTIQYHTIPYHIMPCHAMPCHAMPCHAIPYHTIPYHAMPCHTIPYHTVKYNTIQHKNNTKPQYKDYAKHNTTCHTKYHTKCNTTYNTTYGSKYNTKSTAVPRPRPIPCVHLYMQTYIHTHLHVPRC